MTEPLLLMGAPGSPYTRKMLAVLRYRNIPHRFIVRGSPLLAALPKPKVELLPTFYLKNAAGELEAVTDSTPLIRRFEAECPGPRVQPADPVLRFIDSVIEDYADEWLTKAMFHYRWHYADDIAKSANILPRWRNITMPEATAQEHARLFSQRQISRLRYVGSSPATAGVIEDSYLRFLAAFEAHLAVQPFLMGARPSASDFGVYGQLTQLAHFDPTPAALTLAKAPRVYAWVGVVDDLSGLQPAEDQWTARDALPPTLVTLLEEVARVYLPVMLANARALKAGAPQVEATVDGKPWVQNPFPYQAKCLGWLRDEFRALGADDRRAADALLERAGLGALVHAAI
ncbi:MAG: glutathione S-transferase [Burkholderiales bacterium]|nr:glutathione S-transferase [Burkholderiales bacterium]